MSYDTHERTSPLSYVFSGTFGGIGLALTETMSVGLPVVTYKSCSACAEFIKDDEEGLLADDGTKSLEMSCLP